MFSNLIVLPCNTRKQTSGSVEFRTSRFSYNNLSAQNHQFQSVSFKAFKNPLKPKTLTDVLKGLSSEVVNFINTEAYRLGMSNDDYLKKLLNMPHIQKVSSVISKGVKIGNAEVTTLMDGRQIFDKTLKYIQSAKKSIQIEMFEFQNLAIDGDKWVTNGAENVPGAKEQQQILWNLLKKKQENPNMKIQIILDAHKWYIDGKGNKKRHYGNQSMIRFLKQKGIDVVPYPRQAQGGSALQHIKLMVIDSKKAILGGMNWGSHSAANHDACISVETLPNQKNSIVDNLLDRHFIPDWKLSWKKLGETKLVNGPLTKEEQKFYNGIDKEIKAENIEYVKLVKEFYDMPDAKNRYKEGRLDLDKVFPVKNPEMKVLGTKPVELEEVGSAGDESTRKYLLDKLQNCKKLKAELFVLTDKELVETIVKRVKNNELDAEFIISADILQFPYCRMSYQILKENNIPVRIYKTDMSVNQRLHAKWAVFDEKEVFIGSTNWSARGLNQNIKKGFRLDTPLSSEKINNEVKEYAEDLKEFEVILGIPSSNDVTKYSNIAERIKIFRTVLRDLEKNEEAVAKIGGKEYKFSSDNISEINTVLGYYSLIRKRLNAKEKYIRGNNELGFVFESPTLAKQVFIEQFNLDFDHSKSKYNDLKNIEWPIKNNNDENLLDVVG